MAHLGQPHVRNLQALDWQGDEVNKGTSVALTLLEVKGLCADSCFKDADCTLSSSMKADEATIIARTSITQNRGALAIHPCVSVLSCWAHRGPRQQDGNQNYCEN